jgi:hypothetical protein
MFGRQLIGYAQNVDAEVQHAADQPTAQDEGQHNWRSWFGKKGDETVAEDASDNAETAGSAEKAEGAGDAGDAGAAKDAPQATDDPLLFEGPPVDDGPLLDGQAPAEQADPGSAAAGGQPDLIDPKSRRHLRAKPISLPLVSKPLINPKLTSDPRLRIWILRIGICLVAFTAVTIWKGWRYGLTAAVVCAAIDTLFRSRTTGITPTSVRVTSAQKATARKLKVLQAAGYMTLNTRRLPGSSSVVDHIVVGPSGIFTVDSQRFDTRLPLRAKGGVLYHGPVSMEPKLDHAKFEADKAAELIGAELGQRVRVRPAMVIYGPNIPWIIMRVKGVDTFDGGHVGAYFRRQSKATIGHHLDNAQIALVFSAAAHALPDLD